MNSNNIGKASVSAPENHSVTKNSFPIWGFRWFIFSDSCYLFLSAYKAVLFCRHMQMLSPYFVAFDKFCIYDPSKLCHRVMLCGINWLFLLLEEEMWHMFYLVLAPFTVQGLDVKCQSWKNSPHCRTCLYGAPIVEPCLFEAPHVRARWKVLPTSNIKHNNNQLYHNWEKLFQFQG